MGQTRTQRVIKQLAGTPTIQKRTPIATGMFLPNHSGDHSAGIVNSTPTNDLDLVNKAYVDDEITTNVPVPLTIALGGTQAISFTENTLVYKGPTNLLSLANPGTAGLVLRSNVPASLPTWSSTTYPNTAGTGAMLYGSAPNIISTSVTLLYDGNDLKLQGDSKKLYFGTANDYSVEWTGSDAVHTISAGDFVFMGGNLDISTVGAGVLSILTPNDTTGTLAFGDPQDADNGKIYYNHANTDMYFNVNGGTGLRLKGATKYLRVGDATNPAAPLHVYNSAFDEIAYFQCADDLCRIRIADNDTNTYVIAKDGLSQIGQTNTISTNNISINATGDVVIGGDFHIQADSKKLYFGAADDVSLSFNATDLVIKADETGTNGVQILTSAAEQLGFHGTSPIAQAVLATGAGATVDNVITALQNLGLVKQA